MPTSTSSPLALAEHLSSAVARLPSLADRVASSAGAWTAATSPRARQLAARWRALPATRRWQAIAAALTGLVLLTVYVLTLQAAVERGEALRTQQRQQGLTAVASPSGVTKTSARSTRT